MGKSIKKLVGVAAPIVGGLVGGPAGAAIGSAVGGLVGGSGQPSGSVGRIGQGARQILDPILAQRLAGQRQRELAGLQERILPDQQQGLRISLAEGAQPIADDITGRTTAAADAVTAAGEELGNTLLDQMVQSGILSADLANEIRSVSANIGVGLEDAAERVLGPDGVVSGLQQLNQSIPGIVENASAQLDQLAGTVEQDIAPFQGEITDALTGLSGDLAAARGQLTEAGATPDAVNLIASGGAPAGFERFFGGADQTGVFQDLTTAAQQQVPDIQMAARNRIAAATQQLDEEEANALQDLQDTLAAQGFSTDSGLYFEATNALRRDFARQKTQQINQIQQEADVQTAQLSNQALTTAGNIAGQEVQGRIGAGGQQAQVALTEAERQQRLGEALTNIGLNQAQAQAVLAGQGAQIGFNIRDVQSRLLQEAATLGLNAADVTAGILGQQAQAANIGAGILQGAGQTQLAGTQAAGNVELQNLQNQQALEQQAIQAPGNALTQAAQLTAQTGQPLITAGLTGLTTGIAGLGPALVEQQKRLTQAEDAAAAGRQNLATGIGNIAQGVIQGIQGFRNRPPAPAEGTFRLGGNTDFGDLVDSRNSLPAADAGPPSFSLGGNSPAGSSIGSVDFPAATTQPRSLQIGALRDSGVDDGNFATSAPAGLSSTLDLNRFALFQDN